MIRIFFILVTSILLFACQPAPTVNNSKSTTSIAVIPDTIFVEVDSSGKMLFGGKDIPDTDVLKARLSDSLSTFRKLGGKVPVMWYHTHGDVLMGMRGELFDVFTEVKEAGK